MKTLIIVYSRSGHTKTVAEHVARKLRADIELLIDKNNRSGLLGYIGAGHDALRKKKTSIQKTKHDPATYDLIILGTPVWAGTYTPALHTYIDTYKNVLTKKNVCFLATMGAQEPQKTFVDLKALLGRNPLATLALQTKRVRKENINSNIEQFIKHIKKNI